MDMEKVLTVCPYCGTGCGLNLLVENNHIIGIEPDSEHPVSGGELCVKGYFGYKHIQDSRRLTAPLIRKDGKFAPVTWGEALDFVAGRLTEIKQKSGPDAFALFASARAPNEENYVAQKFARAVIGTNNIDHCARL